MDGKIERIGVYYGFGDTVIESVTGEYFFIYQKLGTKGLLIKNGELLREINRSYYFSNAYEYPAAFVTIDNKTYLVHCPVAYNQLDFEDVETGEIVTNTKHRNPNDQFHSRLEISPDGLFLMSKGWIWHPIDIVAVYDIKACLKDPCQLDQEPYHASCAVEVCTASFVDNNLILIGTSDEVFHEEAENLPTNSILLWDFKSNKFSSPVKVEQEFGNLVAIDSNLAWDFYLHPKIININNGKVISINTAIESGNQRSAILTAEGNYPSLIVNNATKQAAIMGNERIELLSPPVLT